MLGHADEARRHLEQALAVRLADVQYLTQRGVTSVMDRLWKTVGVKLAEDDPLRAQLEHRLLAAGIAPDEVFEAHRERAEVSDNVHFYRCRLRQPLDASWPASEGCLAGQQAWTSYFALWGVLARDEAEAAKLVQAWQGRCSALPSEVLDCEQSDGVYRDRPGVVWQGQRWQETN
jgi:hypothetical protein